MFDHGFITDCCDFATLNFWNPNPSADCLTGAANGFHAATLWASLTGFTFVAACFFATACWLRDCCCAASGDPFTNSFPFSAADVDPLSFADWFANGVANIAVAGFGLNTVVGDTDFFVASLIDRLADGLANCAVTGFCYRS